MKAPILSAILLTSSVYAGTLSDEPTVHLTFNGSAVDISGNNNHGTINGATLTADRFGNPDSAFHFDGVNDYISIQDNESFTVMDVSVAAWIKTTDKSDMKHITSCYGTGMYSEWYNLYITSQEGTARWQSDRGGIAPPVAIGTTDVADGNWHFIVGTRNTVTGELKIYVDGQLEAIQIESFPVELNPEVDFWIGAQNGFANRYFTGDIDDVRVYSRTLSEGEIVSLYEPLCIELSDPLNEDGCVEAKGPEGTTVHFVAESADPSPYITYHWSTSSGDTGSEKTFECTVGVDQQVTVSLVVENPATGSLSTADKTVCVSDTTPPEIRILSPESGDVFYGNNLHLEVVIMDLVDQSIPDYEVMIGTVYLVPLDSGPSYSKVKLLQPDSSFGPVPADVIVTTQDASGNISSATVQVMLQKDNRK